MHVCKHGCGFLHNLEKILKTQYSQEHYSPVYITSSKHLGAEKFPKVMQTFECRSGFVTDLNYPNHPRFQMGLHEHGKSAFNYYLIITLKHGNICRLQFLSLYIQDIMPLGLPCFWTQNHTQRGRPWRPNSTKIASFFSQQLSPDIKL